MRLTKQNRLQISVAVAVAAFVLTAFLTREVGPFSLVNGALAGLAMGYLGLMALKRIAASQRDRRRAQRRE